MTRGAPQPMFSVIIATRNRPGPLGDLLESLCRLSPQTPRYEVIVVDDGGSIPLQPLVERFAGRLMVRLSEQKRAGPGAARNRGAALAAGAYLAFIDDDCRAHHDWLASLSQALAHQPDALCGGRTLNALPNNIYSEASSLLWDFLYQHYNPEQVLGAFFPANNLVVPAGAFRQMGGFDPGLRFGEDRELCRRWAGQGKAFRYVPRALVFHANRLNLGSFLKLHFAYGKGTYLFRKRCRARGWRPSTINAPGFYLALILSGYRSGLGLWGLGLSLLLLASMGCYVLGFFSQAGKSFLSVTA